MRTAPTAYETARAARRGLVPPVVARLADTRTTRVLVVPDVAAPRARRRLALKCVVLDVSTNEAFWGLATALGIAVRL